MVDSALKVTVAMVKRNTDLRIYRFTDLQIYRFTDLRIYEFTDLRIYGLQFLMFQRDSARGRCGGDGAHRGFLLRGILRPCVVYFFPLGVVLLLFSCVLRAGGVLLRR